MTDTRLSDTECINKQINKQHLTAKYVAEWVKMLVKRIFICMMKNLKLLKINKKNSKIQSCRAAECAYIAENRI